MRSPAYIFATFSIVLAATFGYFLYIGDYDQQVYYTIPTITFAMIGTGLVAVRYPVDMWWYKMFPPTLEKEIVQLFEQLLPFFQQLDLEGKKEFAKRVTLFLLDVDIKFANQDPVPRDFECLVAAMACQSAWHREKYMYDKLQKVIFYPRAFHTPDFHEYHMCEYHRDGVIILSLQDFQQGISNPNTNLNIATYCFNEYWLQNSTNSDFYASDISKNDIEKLYKIRNITEEMLKEKNKLPYFDLHAFYLETYYYLKSKSELNNLESNTEMLKFISLK